MFNKEILNYSFPGVPRGSDRSVITTLKQCLIGNDVVVNASLDSIFSCYKLVEDWPGKYVIQQQKRGEEIIVSPEEFLNLFLGQDIDLQWFRALQPGDTVQIGWCSADTGEYQFGFNTNLVIDNFLNTVTIGSIDPGPTRENIKWYNGDDNAYFIKELSHYLPSSVFIPKVIPITPIKSVELSSISLKMFNL